MFAPWKKEIKKEYFNKNVNSTCAPGVEIKVALCNSAIVRAIHCQISGVTSRQSEQTYTCSMCQIIDFATTIKLQKLTYAFGPIFQNVFNRFHWNIVRFKTVFWVEECLTKHFVFVSSRTSTVITILMHNSLFPWFVNDVELFYSNILSFHCLSVFWLVIKFDSYSMRNWQWMNSLRTYTTLF